MEPLRSERLLLRAWRDADREPFAALNADPEVMEHFPAPLSREQSDALADHAAATVQERGWGWWAVERRADGAFLGFTGLADVPLGLPFTGTEIGWRLRRNAWGHGFATEAAHAALAFAFGPLGLTEVVSMTAATNLRSQAVMRRLGMVRDPAGDFGHPRVPTGHPARAHVLFRLRRGCAGYSAVMVHDRDPDMSEDPRGQDVGQGYPETQAGHGSGDDAIDKGKYPDSGEHGGTQADGPSPSSDSDSDPSSATGNPDAAG